MANKTKQLNVRISEQDYERLQRITEAFRCSQGEFVVMAIAWANRKLESNGPVVALKEAMS